MLLYLKRHIFAASVAIAGLVGSSLAAPINDNFSAAQILQGSFLQINGTTVASTKEAGEPTWGSGSIPAPDLSVWYSWVAPRNGIVGVGATFADSVFTRYLHLYQASGTRSIFSLSRLGSDLDQRAVSVPSTAVAGGTEYFIRVSGRSSGDEGTFTFSLAFTPIYSTGVAFSGGRSKLKKKNLIRGFVTTPQDVGSLSVRSSGKGRPARLQYDSASGAFSFLHKRKGPKPKRGRSKRVTYTITASKNGAVIGQASRRYRIK